MENPHPRGFYTSCLTSPRPPQIFTSEYSSCNLTMAVRKTKMVAARINSWENENGAQVFRIKASYSDQMELRTSLERARVFPGELRNVADLMPGIEGIRNEAGGLMSWIG